MKKPGSANKIGRKRRAAGWTLLALGVLAAAAWVASRWWWICFGWGIQGVICNRGTIEWQYGEVINPPDGLVVYPSVSRDWIWWHGWRPAGIRGRKEISRTYGLYRWDYFSVASTDNVGASFVLWPAPFFLWTPGVLLIVSGIRAKWRVLDGYCVECGYWLGGLAAGATCPECGRA